MNLIPSLFIIVSLHGLVHGQYRIMCSDPGSKGLVFSQQVFKGDNDEMRITKTNVLNKLQDLVTPSVYYGTIHKCFYDKSLINPKRKVNPICMSCVTNKGNTQTIIHCSKKITGDKTKTFSFNRDHHYDDAKLIAIAPSSIAMFGQILSDAKIRYDVSNSIFEGIEFAARGLSFQLLLNGIGTAVNFIFPATIIITPLITQLVIHAVTIITGTLASELNTKLLTVDHTIISAMKCLSARNDYTVGLRSVYNSNKFDKIKNDLNNIGCRMDLSTQELKTHDTTADLIKRVFLGKQSMDDSFLEIGEKTLDEEIKEMMEYFLKELAVEINIKHQSSKVTYDQKSLVPSAVF